MFNVLPESIKNQRKAQYKRRLIILWLITVIALQISLVIFIMPSYVSLVLQEKGLVSENQAAGATSTTTDTNANANQIFQNANTELGALAYDIQPNDLSLFLSRLVSLKDSSIKFTDISYQNKTPAASTIMLQGVATNREALLSFSKRIEADNLFATVNLPVSNFAKDKNINFSMSITTSI